MSLSWSHWPKTPKPNLNNFFFILIYTMPLVIIGFEQLSSSICCQLWLANVCPARANYAFSEKFWIRPKTRFLTHNFGYRYASRSIQGSIDVDSDLVLNKSLSQKSGSMSWGPGPAKGGKNFQNMPSLWCDLQKSPHRKRKTFFFDFEYNITESLDDLDSSLAQSPGEL